MSSEKAIRTRASIIAAARSIILKEGIGALTMDRAAQEAGMSKGACMYHFKTKRALQWQLRPGRNPCEVCSKLPS